MDKSPDAFRTISEVADVLETPAHVLRFWESRFPQIKPVKRAGGRRYYRPADVALLAGIRQLLHQDGMTIRGVQKILRDQGVRYVISLTDPNFSAPLDSEVEDEDSAVEAVPEVSVPEMDGVSNIVTLTEWRTASDPNTDAVDVSGLAPVNIDDSVASEQTQAAPLPLAGASLAPEPETILVPAQDADAAASSAPAPLQWSLFDLSPEPAPVENPADMVDLAPETVETAFLAPEAASEEPRDSAIAAPEAVFEVESPIIASEAPAPLPDVAVEPESPAPVAEAAFTPVEADDLGDAPQALPWLPPRLRALQAQAETVNRAEFVPLLARARALHARLKEANQTRRG